MKMLLAATLSLLAVQAASAQPAAAPAPAAPPAAPREPPSNDAAGLTVDQFVGYADRAAPHIMYDVIQKRTILSGGDPTRPGAPRAVMPYHNELALLELGALNTTSMFKTPDQLVLYVETGQGRIDDGKQVWDLKPGIAILIPPNLAHRLSNTGDTPMKILMTSQTLDPSVKPRADILVRDTNKLVYTERNVHWSNQTKYVFQQEDGLFSSDKVYIVYMGGWTIAGAHAHTPGQEEVWVKLTDGPAALQVGSEIRPWPMNAGLMAPPNGKSVHAAINLSHDVQSWFYMGRLAPFAQPRPANAPPRPGSEAIAEGLRNATIAGRPLPSEGKGRTGR
ncbi:hypothetical protein DJ021_12530 [Phenylobacterium hankyongense]|uniref:Cupin type-2 domain-containing protein n=1 Tax=Phenylobacterium hankyongense TaxID=1813876 RepID=A0A328B2A0_9CAUL|nr:cupin domain-containing protein [Phenylobacterium hankyongense]RAK60571.1 hypothetical protein DJ021_12530 [Phenylobacterium hankyongense]